MKRSTPAHSTLVSPVLLAACALGAVSMPVLAQTNITPANKYSWSENCGFMNWADANGGA